MNEWLYKYFIQLYNDNFLMLILEIDYDDDGEWIDGEDYDENVDVHKWIYFGVPQKVQTAYDKSLGILQFDVDMISTLLYYTILYYTILYYTILYYTILYYTNCTILYYVVLCYTIFFFTKLYYNLLYYAFYSILYYTLLY